MTKFIGYLERGMVRVSKTKLRSDAKNFTLSIGNEPTCFCFYKLLQVVNVQLNFIFYLRKFGRYFLLYFEYKTSQIKRWTQNVSPVQNLYTRCKRDKSLFLCVKIVWNAKLSYTCWRICTRKEHIENAVKNK